MIAFASGLLCLHALAAPLPHDPGLSSVRVTRTTTALTIEAAFANADFFNASAIDQNRDGKLDASELAAATEQLRVLAAGGFVVTAQDSQEPLQLLDASFAIGADRDVVCNLVFPPCEAVADVRIAFLQHLGRAHRCYIAAVDANHEIVADALLHGNDTSMTLPASAVATPVGFGQGAHFFALGIEHILIGFDHLAFLLALLAAGVTFRSVVTTITAFTVAHSITLAAAALDLVHLPSALVESVIAASIVWVAVANLWQRGRPGSHRWPLALGFGLIHGFGFASVLADLQVGGAGALVPLVTFNLGVEVGQLAFALAVVPLLVAASRSAPWRSLPLLLSAAVGLCGIWWFFERVSGN